MDWYTVSGSTILTSIHDRAEFVLDSFRTSSEHQLRQAAVEHPDTTNYRVQHSLQLIVRGTHVKTNLHSGHEMSRRRAGVSQQTSAPVSEVMTVVAQCYVRLVYTV